MHVLVYVQSNLLHTTLEDYIYQSTCSAVNNQMIKYLLQ